MPYSYEIIEAAALATASLRREWHLLDRNVCGIREIEPSMIAVRVTVLDGSGAPQATVDAAYYPEIGEFGVAAGADGSEPAWLTATSLEEGIERWARRRAWLP